MISESNSVDVQRRQTDREVSQSDDSSLDDTCKEKSAWEEVDPWHWVTCSKSLPEVCLLALP